MKLNLLVLRVADLARSRDFYTAIGMELAEERHGSGPLHLSAKLHGCVLELYPASASSPATNATRFGLSIAHLEPTIDRAITAGGSIITQLAETEWGRRAVVADPDGHKIELTEDDEIPW